MAAALTGLGAQHAPRPAWPRPTAAQAAAHIGAPVAAIANSLIFACDGQPLLAITSGGHRADPLTLAALLGADPCARRPCRGPQVDPPTDRGRRTGRPPHPLQTLVDVELAHFDTVWCGAGHPDWVFPTSYAELLRITAGEAAEVGDLSVTEAP